MTGEVIKLWSEELDWFEDRELRDKTARVWEIALERSELKADDLNRIPFTLLVGPDLKVTFMDDKTAVPHISRESGLKVNKFFKDELPVNKDVLISGAILCNVIKLLEDLLDKNGNAVQGANDKYLKHPISGVALAEEFGWPPEVCNINAIHADEGDIEKTITEAYIVHHSDCMRFIH